jgi:hypothetical protein
VIFSKPEAKMAATIQIHPIVVFSKGRHRVVISGISPTDHDCIVGELFTRTDGPIPAFWDLAGYRRGGRGGEEPSNLDMGLDELQALSKLAIQLGAKR